MSHHPPPPPPPASPPADGDDRDDGPPFGLPVLAELPELAGVLQRLVSVDRLLAETLDTLICLQDSGRVEAATGVGLEQWLSIIARRTGSDVRMLACAVRACRRLPSLHHAFSDGRLSWSQTRLVALRTDKVPQLDDLALDAALAQVIDSCQDAEPDALGRMLSWAIDALRPPPDPQNPPATPERGFLHLQPRLDGTGGTLYGDLDALSFAIIDANTTPTTPPHTPATRDRFAGPTDPTRANAAAHVTGRQRLANLLQRLTAPSLSDTAASSNDGDGGDSDGEATPPVHLLLRAELDTLLATNGLPAQLLTTLAGGAVRVDAPTARRLTDRGCSLRLIITDHGNVVGIGRRSKAPPGWLRDAALALHDTCSAPGCDRPALTAHLDHATPWTAGGTTDITNCGPLCRHDNHHKEGAGWRAHGRPDGTRHWHHPRTGLTTTTHPATKRPVTRPRGDPPDG